MTEQIGTVIPEDSVEAEDHLVEVAVAEPLKRGNLPVRQGRVECDDVGCSGGVVGHGLLEDAEGERAQHRVRLVRHGVRVVAGVASRHLHAVLAVPDLVGTILKNWSDQGRVILWEIYLANCGVEFYVESFAQGNRNTTVSVPKTNKN